MEHKHVHKEGETYIPDLIQAVERLIVHAMRDTDKRVAPIRQSAFARFPLLFTLLGALGAGAVTYGFNRTLDTIQFAVEHPVVISLIGLAVLAGTGTLYKRLS